MENYKPLSDSTLERKSKKELISIIRYIEQYWVDAENELYEVERKHDAEINQIKSDYDNKIRLVEEHWLNKYINACEKNKQESTNYDRFKNTIEKIVKTAPSKNKDEFKIDLDSVQPIINENKDLKFITNSDIPNMSDKEIAANWENVRKVLNKLYER